MIKPDKIIRSDRKTLSVGIDAFGRITVRAPRRTSDERINAFLKEKEAWILKHTQNKAGRQALLPSENLNGFTFLLLGETHRLILYNGGKVRYEKPDILLPIGNAKERLVKWLKENAKRIFTEACTRRAAEMGVAFPSVSVTSARTRWGSCSYNNALHFTFRLLYAPKEVIDYVIVHELCHIKEKNHGANFWSLVGKYCPDYKEKRAWLRSRGYLLHIF